jgi:beta-phosphoglucomutase-like phosphatase (HAD superfamily)
MIEILNNMLTNKNILIFDLDGTIVNTDKANFLAYKEAVREIKNIDLSSVHDNFPNPRFSRSKLPFHLG